MGTPLFTHRQISGLNNSSRPFRVPAASQTGLHGKTNNEPHHSLRMKLGSVFPNALLLDDGRLPDLYSSRHYVNLTNGLDLTPLLSSLALPFSVVRIRSTSLEQQAFESLLLELDANLLLHLALGHSCIVWDTGCRNRKTGAPRALWYGLEFIRFTLNRCWCNTRADSSSSSSSVLLRAHIRGHDVSRDFEAACRSLQPSTKSRLRYYKRYTPPAVQQRGVRLASAFRRTERDEDVAHFVALAQQYCGPAASSSSGLVHNSSSCGQEDGSSDDKLVVAQQQQQPSAASAAAAAAGSSQSVLDWAGSWTGQSEADQRSLLAYQQLVAEGIGLFTGGLSHTEFRALQGSLGVVGSA